MPISVCPSCTRYYVTEAKKKHRCPECRRKLEPATPEEWQRAAQKPREKPVQLRRV